MRLAQIIPINAVDPLRIFASSVMRAIVTHSGLSQFQRIHTFCVSLLMSFYMCELSENAFKSVNTTTA